MLERPRWLAARSAAPLRSAPENPPPPDDLSAAICGLGGSDFGLDAGRLAGFEAGRLAGVDAGCGLESAILPADGPDSRPRSTDFAGARFWADGARFCADGAVFACGTFALADAALDAAFDVAAGDCGNFAFARTSGFAPA